MDMPRRLAILLVAFTIFQALAGAVQGLAQKPGNTIWLDLPLKPWNAPGTLPHAPVPSEPLAEVSKRCDLKPLRGTAAQRAVAEAGWIPYLHFDRQIVQGEVEILGGMTGADGMCRPTGFNSFVFVANRFAGTLSPIPMISRTDGSIGPVRVAPDGTITADFARYSDNDALCCPSSHVDVRYRIDRANQPVVIPTGNPTTRR